MTPLLKKHGIAICFAILASALLFIISSSYMLGVSPDSSHYLMGAKNLLLGNDFRGYDEAIINHFPPGYSFFVAGMSKLTGLSILAGGRLLNVLFIGLFFIVTNQLLRLTKLNTWTLIAINIFLLAGTPLLYVFSHYWSEGISIVLILAAFYTYAKSDFTPTLGQCVLIGLYLGILLLIRFAGIGIIMGIVGHLFFFSRHSMAKRIVRIVVIFLPVLVLFLSWHFYSVQLGVESVDREIAMHIIPLKKVLKFIFVPLRWLIPIDNRAILSAFLVIILGMAFFVRNALWNNRVFIFMLWSVGMYSMFLVVSISLIDFATPIDNRILSLIAPLYLAMVFIIVTSFFNIGILPVKLKPTHVGLILLMLSLLPVYRTLYPHAKSMYKVGLGYNTKGFFSDEVAAHIHNSRNKKKVIYTNGPDLINYYLNFKEAGMNTDFTIQYYPQKYGVGDKVKNDSYEQELYAMVDAINNDARNTVIHFNSIKRGQLPQFDDFAQYVDTQYINKYADCAIIQKK